MTDGFPRVTISVTDKKEGSGSAGDLNALSVGLGLFQAWIFTTMFGAQNIFGADGPAAQASAVSDAAASAISTSYAVSLALLLLAISLTNQLFLRFYVGKNALVTATVLASLGTLLIFATGFAGMPVAVLSGVLMGASASLMIVLWGTAYARYEFTTIIFNSAAAMVIGVVAYLALTAWILPPVAGGLTSLLPIGSSFLLWRLTPIPYYRRHEIPIFHPLRIKQTAFLLRFGVPALVFGFTLGVLRKVCLADVLMTAGISSQLVGCAAAVLAVVMVLLAAAVAHEESHWDMIFRILVPVVAVGVFCIPALGSAYALAAGFFVVCAFICLESLMWIFFSDLAQEFRLSPIYVFGLGRSLLTLGAIFGMTVAEQSLFAGSSGLAAGASGAVAGITASLASYETAMAALLALALAYCLLPRQREVSRIISPIPHKKDEQAYAQLQNTLISPSPHQADADASELSPDDAQRGDSVAAAQKEDGEKRETEEQVRKGRFHMRCEEIADRYLLSRRETEVMFLLAKGHNAAYIQDKLCISKSTAKTHINHIYRKLDIHTQQELLNMVEEDGNDAQAPQQAFAKGRKARRRNAPKAK